MGMSWNRAAHVLKLEYGRKNRSRLEKAAHLRAILHHPAKRHRAAFYRQILEPARRWHLPLRVLRRETVQLRNQVRFGHRMAQLLRAARRKKSAHGGRP